MDLREQLELLSRVMQQLPRGRLLPPPITIRLRPAPHRSGKRLDVTVMNDRVSCCDHSIEAFCEVTSCLDPEIRANHVVDVGSFRDWARSNAGHPLAIRYQPLYAWLLAARCDERFLGLANDFIRCERARLQAELTMAAMRVLQMSEM